ncbi:MAG: PAS domain-containing protein [Methylobacteriaceae bacterium]|nr:PAS domain-containing protein [Methylobacteriaceae bacterium]
MSLSPPAFHLQFLERLSRLLPRFQLAGRPDSEKERSQQTIAESEARYRLLADSLPHLVWTMAPDGTVSYMNATLSAYLGGLGALDEDGFRHVHPDDRPISRHAFTGGLKQEQPFTFEARLARTDGEWRHHRFTLVPRKSGGVIVDWIGTALDIDDLHRAQTELRHKEEHLRLALEGARLTTWQRTVVSGMGRWHGGIVQTLSPRLTEEHGRDVFLSLVHPDDRNNIKDKLRAVREHNADYDAVFRLKSEIGEWRWIASRARVFDREDEAAARMIGVAQDITEQRRAEMELSESEAFLRGILESSADCIKVLDLAGKLIFMNGPGLRAMEIDDLQPFLGKQWTDFLPRENQPDFRRAVEHARKGESSRLTALLPTFKGGKRWWDIQITPVLDARAGRPERILAISRDITEERRQAEELERLNDELEDKVARRTQALADAARELAGEMHRREEAQAALVQAQKIEALGQFTGGIAHDFNNVLAAVLGTYRMIKRRTSDEQVLEFVRHGESAAERAAGLVRQLMGFARREELRPARAEPAELMKDVAPLVRHAVGTDIVCEIDIDEACWPIVVDRQRLEVSLLNLVVNARDAMKGRKGSVRVCVRNEENEFRNERVRLGPHVVFTIEDSGSGMAPDVAARATEPFFTTKPRGSGTGLGLATAHGFAEQSGGALVIESHAGIGTKVSIVLPRAPFLDEEPAAQIDPNLHGRAVILLVDDDQQVRPLTASFLRDLGYTIIEAPTAEIAFALAHAPEALDLVITDVVMPGADGPKLASRLRRERGDLPILFITGHADPSELKNERVLQKPFSHVDLADSILRMLGRIPAETAL